MSDEEKFHHEANLKMQLLREHMREDVGEEFQYHGTALQSVAKAAVEVIAKKG